MRSRSAAPRNDSSATTGTGERAVTSAMPARSSRRARLLVAFDDQPVGEHGVEQLERVGGAEAGVGVEANARARDRRADRAQRREIGAPVATDLDLEAVEARGVVAARRLDHARGIRDRQRDVGQERRHRRRASRRPARARAARRQRGTRHPGSRSRRRRARPRCRAGRAQPTQRASSDRRRLQTQPPQRRRHVGDRREQVGLVLARDRRQRGGLAEAPARRPAASSTVARTSAARVTSIRPDAITNGSRSGTDSGATSMASHARRPIAVMPAAARPGSAARPARGRAGVACRRAAAPWPRSAGRRKD